MKDVHFNAALSDADLRIVHRRSGKPRRIGVPSIARLLPANQFSLAAECTDPEEILASGKALARALVAGLDANARLSISRTFCASVIKNFWFESQRDFGEPWALPDQFFPSPNTDLDESTAFLAVAMGRAAARLDPIKASYLIGVTYTAMLPDETRSRLGVFYTPPPLTERLLEMATLAGVDWVPAAS